MDKGRGPSCQPATLGLGCGLARADAALQTLAHQARDLSAGAVGGGDGAGKGGVPSAPPQVTGAATDPETAAVRPPTPVVTGTAAAGYGRKTSAPRTGGLRIRAEWHGQSVPLV